MSHIEHSTENCGEDCATHGSKPILQEWEEKFDKEFSVVTEVEFGHQHFTKLPTPVVFKSFIRSLLLSEKERVVKVIKRIRKEQKLRNSGTSAGYYICQGYNQALSDILSTIKEDER